MTIIIPVHSNAKIFIANSSDLLGKTLVEELTRAGAKIISSPPYCQRLSVDAWQTFFCEERVDQVVINAVASGGIQKNLDDGASLLFHNATLRCSLAWAAHTVGISSIVHVASSCMYPTITDRSIDEADLHTGCLERSSRPYALANLATTELIQALSPERYVTVVPTTLYGPHDTFDGTTVIFSLHF